MKQMLLKVRVKTNKKTDSIKKMVADYWEVSIVERPVEGRANRKLIELVAKELKVSPGRVRLKRGEHCRDKLLEILL